MAGGSGKLFPPVALSKKGGNERETARFAMRLRRAQLGNLVDCRIHAGSPQFVSRTAKDWPNAVFRHADDRADLLVGLSFQMIHTHDLGLGVLQAAEQPLDLVVIAHALLGVGMWIGNPLGAMMRRVVSQAGAGTPLEHFAHDNSSGDDSQISGQAALRAKIPQKSKNHS